MKDGLLQQVDTPQNLYDRPDNVFVAGFMGSPSMNFFDATITGSDGEMYIDTGSFRLKVPAERQDPYKGYKGKQIIFGLRPENIHDPEFAPPGIHQALVESKVDVTELMGNEVILYLNAKDKAFLARVDPRSKMRVGNTIGIAFDMDRFHIFDKQTEKAIR
jgi:multiple sugar transport system ATP-binding protein